MNIIKKIAASLALLIGFMSVFAGSKVLLGIDTKEYNVLIWLVSYNVLFGLISIYTGFLIWKEKPMAKNLSLFILAMHLLVFIYLKFMSTTVATESIGAMLFRTSIWLIIIILFLILPKFLNKKL